MMPDEAKKFLTDNQVKYVFAQFVDIHGAAKVKVVPADHFNDVITVGAGFAGGAVWGLGLEPASRLDYMAVGDLETLTLVPWQPGYARIVCDGHIGGKPWIYDSRVVLKKQVARLRARGMTFYTGLEPEFSLLRKNEAGEIVPCEDSDVLRKPCYDYKGLSRSREFLERLTDSVKVVGLDVYQIDHEDA
ncbi:MAG: type III glutamate--ammonia ligase, partial [Zoogloeaceae bacterium]|nr:type III glutamate--ammonia ligase [Zoogloeaceae bacterium]